MPTKTITFPTQIDLDQFISAQAHDLRTPFNHIIGFSKMTLNTITDAPLTSYQKEDLNTIYRSGLRALYLMNGLIDVARLNRHEKEIKLAETDIQQLVDQSLAQWKKVNPGYEAEIETHLLVTSASMQADEPLLRQIVTGFLTFVAQYCESKQTITLTIEEIPDQMTFSFASSGTHSRLPSELDLELMGYVNQALVELHSGRILCAEENDNGALVKFALPKA